MAKSLIILILILLLLFCSAIYVFTLTQKNVVCNDGYIKECSRVIGVYGFVPFLTPFITPEECHCVKE